MSNMGAPKCLILLNNLVNGWGQVLILTTPRPSVFKVSPFFIFSYIYNLTYWSVVLTFLGKSWQIILLFISLFSIQLLKQSYNIIAPLERQKSFLACEASDLAGVAHSTHLSLPFLTVTDDSLTTVSSRDTVTVCYLDPVMNHLV